MISRNRAGRLSTLLTFGVLLAGAHEAHANDQDLRATTVPATSCQPASSTQAASVVLVSAAWVFSGNNTGTVTFYCPLPVNGNTESNIGDDNDITTFRVFYRDTDGTGTDAEVTARLLYRTTGLFAASSAWSSNASNVMIDTTDFHPAVHDVSNLALYSFVVTLSRTNTTENPAFTGIDFALQNPV